MKTFTLELPGQGTVTYVDRKRYLWLSSVFMPVFPMLGIFVYYATGSEWALGIPLFFSYVVIPFLDFAIGSDANNPPEAMAT